MAKLGKMPQKEIIDGFKGLIDFYYWKGIPVARRWPRYFPRTPSPAEATVHTAFAYINRLWSALPLLVVVQLTLFAARSTLTGKDFLVRGYIKGLYDLMPPEYYATEETQLALLAQLDVALSTRALEAGGNLAAILAQLDVALSTRALEAGGNLANIHGRLDAIKLIQEDLVFASRSGNLSHAAGFTVLVNISAKGILERVEMSSNVTQADLRLTVDGQDFRLIEADGSGVQWVRPLTLYQLGGDSAFWKQSVYDTVNNLYALYLKDPIQYNSALYIGYRQLSGAPANIAVAAYYRPLT